MFRRAFTVRVVALTVMVLGAVSATAAAQTPLPCSAPPELTGDLGFTTMKCTRCSIADRHIPGYADFEFVTEPVLMGITRGGPADGKLEEQDVLVALNGQLITTQAGAILYSWPAPGKLMRMTIRRAGILKDVEVVPVPRCRTITTALSQILRDPRLTIPATSSNPRSGRGWFGVSLSCGFCGLTTESAPLWPFASYPEITLVAADSPADKAGLKSGDLLVAMDGLSLKNMEGTLAFRNVKPGQKVVLSVVRDGDFLKLSLTAGPPR